MKYFRFIFKYFKFTLCSIFLIRNTESFIHIYILISINALTEQINKGYLINNDDLRHVIFASVSLIVVAIVSLFVNLHALRKAKDVLAMELTSTKRRLIGDDHPIKARSIVHIIDTITESGNWFSLPTRFFIIIATLYAFNFSLVWPLISAGVVMLFSFALSRYQYNLAGATVISIKNRSNVIRRLAKRQYLRTEWLKKIANSAVKKELYIRNKATIVDELSQQVPIVISLLFAILITQTSAIPNDQAMVFIFSSMIISSIISEAPSIIGLINKTSTFFGYLLQEKENASRDRLWSGSLESNTLMHDCAEACHDIFESIFGKGFLNKHKLEVDINALSTAQQNVILAIRNAWDKKSSEIPEKYQYAMDLNTKHILASKLKNILKDA